MKLLGPCYITLQKAKQKTEVFFVCITAPTYPIPIRVAEAGQASLIAQLVKNPPAMQETPVQFLGQEDLLEKGQATHSSILGLPWWLSR